MAELESMVASKYHTQEPEARDRLIKNAEPLDGGQREKREGKATGRDSQGPHGFATQIMLQVILLARAAKDTR